MRAIVLFCFILLSLLTIFALVPHQKTQIKKPPVIEVPAGLSELLDNAFAYRKQWTVPPDSRVLLLPHHLVAARGIASLVSSAPRPSIIYLIAPDHFHQGKTFFTTGDQDFQLGDIRVPVELSAVQRLTKEVPYLVIDSKVFVREHGIHALLPYIHHVWPDIPVVPVIVRIDATSTEREAMAQALVNRLHEDPHAILLSSIDFSHYLSIEAANFHDELAEDILKSVSDQQSDRAEVDSPGALNITLRVARLLGLGEVTIFSHTNSLELLKAEITKESTSHFIASFSPGYFQPRHKKTVLTLNDAHKPEDSFFDQIRGQEDRFFWGQDEIVAFDPFAPSSTHSFFGLVFIDGRLSKTYTFPK